MLDNSLAAMSRNRTGSPASSSGVPLTWILELAMFSKNAGADLVAGRQKGW
jgi:hypothetical protein